MCYTNKALFPALIGLKLTPAGQVRAFNLFLPCVYTIRVNNFEIDHIMLIYS